MTDNQQEIDDDKKILDKLKRILIEQEKEKNLSDEEIATLREMIAVYESFQAFGRFSGAARNVILFVGSLLVGWFLLVDKFSIIISKIFPPVINGGGNGQ